MDAVLPLIARDLPRFELAYRSLQRHVRGLDTIFVAVPEHERAQLALPTSQARPRLEWVSELAWLPELSLLTRVPGWYRQQLLKLAAAEHVTSDFYLTLDADVLATRAVDLEALCASGTAPCAVAPHDWHPRWYDGAEALIGAPLARRGITHAVTPTILHRDAVKALAQHLDARWNERRFSPGFRGVKQRLGHAYVRARDARALRGWRCLLCCSRPWAEYALYFSFLEQRGVFTQYHRETREGLYAEERSIWRADDLARWTPAALSGEGPPFVVLQSTAGIPLDTLRAWAAPFL